MFKVLAGVVMDLVGMARTSPPVLWKGPAGFAFEGAGMIKLEFDFAQLSARAAQVGATADQIPYALSRALNDAAEATRSYMIGTTWPSHVNARNKSFIGASLTTRGARATKESLAVEIYDRLDRGNLQLQAKGGTKVAHGGNLAIGGDRVKRGPRGVPQSQRPKNLKNSFKRGNAIYQRVGKGKNEKVRLVYVLRPTAKMRPLVPMYQDFARIMEQELRKSIPKSVEMAMRTRR